MVYNDEVTEQGIVQDTLFEASATAASYDIKDITRNSNEALNKAVGMIIGADSRWQFDSSNYTDLPIGATDIISGQQDYSFDTEYLIIKSIEVRDSTGKWTRLIPIDNMTLEEREAMSGFETTPGIPKYYDKMGESILLYPTPNYNMRLVEEGTAGLRAYFQRKIDYFTTTDTTKKPGFAEHLHKYISLYNAYVYACAKELNNKINTLRARLDYYEGNRLKGGSDDGEFKRFYGYRELDFRRKLTPKIHNTR